MKLNYFDLLSPAPVAIPHTCSIVSPKLKDISSIGFATYQCYLSILFMDIKTYFGLNGCGEAYEKMPNEELAKLNIFDLLITEESTMQLLMSALQFFILEPIMYTKEKNYFLVCNVDGNKIGEISNRNYSLVCDIISQRLRLKIDKEDDLSKIKSKKALEIAKKLKFGRNKKKELSKPDSSMELSNIISAVAGKSQSLNLLNIWDLTVFQLWDYFLRLSNNAIYDIQSMSVATWGDKDKHFDAASWFKRINNEF